MEEARLDAHRQFAGNARQKPIPGQAGNLGCDGKLITFALNLKNLPPIVEKSRTPRP